jgi:general secretion pathway protein A
MNFLQILLIGHPDLEARLHSERFNPFKERIAIKAHIHPFTREEGRDYIGYRLNLVGRDISEVFTAEGVNRILEFAQGNPRVINLLCNRALLIGLDDTSPAVDAQIVAKDQRSASSRQNLKPPRIIIKAKNIGQRLLNPILCLFSRVFLLSLAIIFSLLLQK